MLGARATVTSLSLRYSREHLFHMLAAPCICWLPALAALNATTHIHLSFLFLREVSIRPGQLSSESRGVDDCGHGDEDRDG